MDFAAELASSQMLDCTGQVTHTLTLLPDGNVEVVTPSITAIVNPNTKVVMRPVGARLADQILDQAAVLARDGFAQ